MSNDLFRGLPEKIVICLKKKYLMSLVTCLQCSAQSKTSHQTRVLSFQKTQKDNF